MTHNCTGENIGLVKADERLVAVIKTDIRNMLSLYMQGTPERLPPSQALAEAIALEELSQEILTLISLESAPLL